MKEKLNLTTSDRKYYHAKKSPEILEFGEMQCLTIEGKGNPDAEPFRTAVEKIYALAYAIKFLCKSEDHDFVVPKMECFWYIAGGLEAQHLFTQADKEDWIWKIMIRLPDFVNEEHVSHAKYEVANKETLSMEDLLFEKTEPAEYAHIMHIGSWKDEESSVKSIIDHVSKNGYQIHGYHKEIYISDPRRVKEASKKTILRYEIKKADL